MLNQTLSSLSNKGRNYYEQGCLCILSGRMKKLPPIYTDSEAFIHYTRTCRCSRSNSMRATMNDVVYDPIKVYKSYPKVKHLSNQSMFNNWLFVNKLIDLK